MFNIKDRIPTYPNRKKITFEDTGEEKYALIEYADEPTENGTFLNRSLFLEQFQSLKNHIEYITESGTWTVPENVKSVEVFIVNGGYDGEAGNASSTSSSSSTTGVAGGAGGAGGACCWLPNFSVTPGQTMEVVVGAANGGVSSFNDIYLLDSELVQINMTANYGLIKTAAKGAAGGAGGTYGKDGNSGALGFVNNIYSGGICPIDGKIYGVSGAGGASNRAYRGTGGAGYTIQNCAGGTAGKNTIDHLPAGGFGEGSGDYGWFCGGGGASYDNDGGAGTTTATRPSAVSGTTGSGGNGANATTYGCGGGGGGAAPDYSGYTVGNGGTGAQGVVIIAY